MHTFRRTELQYHEIILTIIDDYIIMIMYVVCSSTGSMNWAVRVHILFTKPRSSYHHNGKSIC